jgi:hypothetical protein
MTQAAYIVDADRTSWWRSEAADPRTWPGESGTENTVLGALFVAGSCA